MKLSFWCTAVNVFFSVRVYSRTAICTGEVSYPWSSDVLLQQPQPDRSSRLFISTNSIEQLLVALSSCSPPTAITTEHAVYIPPERLKQITPRNLSFLHGMYWSYCDNLCSYALNYFGISLHNFMMHNGNGYMKSLITIFHATLLMCLVFFWIGSIMHAIYICFRYCVLHLVYFLNHRPLKFQSGLGKSFIH
jgi:hypothetical protein